MGGVQKSAVYNSAGAYWEPSPFLSIGNSTDSCGSYGSWGQGGGDHDDGLCADLFSRIPPGMGTWNPYIEYPAHSNQTALKKRCAGCMMQSWVEHDSQEGCNNSGVKNEPCKCGSAAGKKGWKCFWDRCYMPSTIPIGCTNPSSYGLITDFVMATPTLLGNKGSPMGVNGEALCKENCMQLRESYYTEFAVYGAGSVPNLTGTFNKNNIYDCEGPQSMPAQFAAVSGPKLIYVGGSSDGTIGYFLTPIGETECGTVDVAWNLQTGAAGEVEIPKTTNGSGTFYSVTDDDWGSPNNYTSVPTNDWVGYLHGSWNAANDFGRLDSNLSGVVSNTDPHLWHRKSKFTIMGQTVSMDDADACCTYVSFGCTDPNFGSYNSQAQLDCAGKAVTNAYTRDNSGALQCKDPDGIPVTVGGSNDYCYGENGLDCSLCINPTTKVYDINQPDCTLPILKACGGNSANLGYLDIGGWVQMVTNTYAGTGINSSLYGDGQIWDKGGRRYASTSGNIGSTWPATEMPLCQCNNVGCLNPEADNYSPLNTLDCNGDAPTGPLDYGQQFCCQVVKEGCPDPNKITAPTANYFCVIDIDGGGVPDNQQWCMHPTTGIPCDQTNCGNSGGVPLGPGTSLQWPDNPLVTVADNGTCDMTLIPGCVDDGGPSAGGLWASPVFPGYAAMNFDPLATIHIQTLCDYVRACPDSSATNSYGKACDGTDFNDLATYYGQTLTYIFDNAIPDATCCDFNLPGSGIGCMDPTALNYNPSATLPGICNYAIEGCTDSNALNYDPLATVEDGSCIYSTDFPEEGDNFLDGTPVQLCREPLTKEEVLMNVCQPTEIQSEVFIERGKQTVFEPNQRLGEVNTIGGLEIYGYGFYNIKTQI